jgi:hypothetical protein
MKKMEKEAYQNGLNENSHEEHDTTSWRIFIRRIMKENASKVS